MERLAVFDAPALLDLAARATLLLAAALLLTHLLRRTAAETRHRLWTTTFVLLLVLPAGVALVPAWDWPVLPALEESARPPATVAVPEAAVDPEPSPDVYLVGPSGATLAASSGGGSSGTPSVSMTPREAESRPSAAGSTAFSLFFWIWALGCAAALLALLVGLLRARALVRNAIPVRDARWLHHTAALRHRLGIRRPVQLLMSEAVTTPLTTGWLHPVIVLPESASIWTAERRHVVLAHELVHIRRHDALRHLLGRATLALYWFHPLGWLAARLAIVSREQACDEGVLALGGRPSDYAAHLLALAEGLHPAPAPTYLPMIQPSQLERRLMAILDPRRPRRNATVNRLVPLCIVVVGLTAAAARPVAPEIRPLAEHPLAGYSAEEAPHAAPDIPSPPSAPAEIAPADNAPAGVTDTPAPLPAQEMTCRIARLRGSFSGTFSTYDDDDATRHEQMGTYNGDRIIQKYIDDLRLCMRFHGDVVLSDDGASVEAIGNEGWVFLESEGDNGLQQLVVTGEANGLAYAWSVDGQQRPFDDTARQWRDRMLVVLNGYWEAATLRGRESSLKGQISSHKGHVSSLNGQISSDKGHVSSLNGQISSYKGHVSSLKGQISSYKGHISSLNGRISSYKGHVSSLKGQISSLRGDISSLEASRHLWEGEDRVRFERRREAIEDQIREVEGQIEAYDLDGKVREVEQQIDDFDLDGKVRTVEQEIEDFDLDGKIREVEQQIEDFDLDGKVRAIEQQIEDFDLDGKVRAIEQEIEDLDADRRADAIERRIEPEVDALRALIRQM